MRLILALAGCLLLSGCFDSNDKSVSRDLTPTDPESPLVSAGLKPTAQRLERPPVEGGIPDTLHIPQAL